MRTYLLALTKYGLAVSVLIYTILAFVILFRNRKDANGLLSWIQMILIGVYTVLSYITLGVALSDWRYPFLMIFQLIIFGAAMMMYRMMFKNAYMPLFNNVCMLLSIGLVIQSRIAFSNATHQLIIVLGSLIIACALPVFRSYFSYLKMPGYIYAFVGVIILAVVMLLGSSTLGANITWTIAGLTFQPSEFVKILYLLFLASTLKDVENMAGLFVIAVFAAAHVLILIGSTDLGSGLIFYVIFLFMVYMATDKILYLVAGFGAAAIGSVAMYSMFDHIQTRVAAYLDPWSYIDSIGYQITQALFAIGAGGMWGSGLGQGTPEKIPFVESDFVFAGVCEEMGLLIGVCLVFLCLHCFLLMMTLAGSFADRFYRLLAYGIAIEYGFQTFLTLGGETKFIPLTGVTLPFISYGGSSILTTMIMFTMVEAMYILRGDKIDEMRAARVRQNRTAPARRNMQRSQTISAPARKTSERVRSMPERSQAAYHANRTTYDRSSVAYDRSRPTYNSGAYRAAYEPDDGDYLDD